VLNFQTSVIPIIIERYAEINKMVVDDVYVSYCAVGTFFLVYAARIYVYHVCM